MLGLSVDEIDGLELSFGEALGPLVGGVEVAIDGEADEGGGDGLFEGELVRPTAGLDDRVAVSLGDADGDAEGDELGLALGFTLGDTDGDALGDPDGDADDNAMGLALGLKLGDTNGDLLGDAEGDTLGLALGLTLGDTDGDLLGEAAGDAEGNALGLALELKLGDTDGDALGKADGDALGGELGLVGAAVMLGLVVDEIEGLVLALIDGTVGGVVLAVTTLNEEAKTSLMTVSARPFFWIVPVRLPSMTIVTSVEFVSAKIFCEHASQVEDTIISKKRVVFSDCNLRYGRLVWLFTTLLQRL